jgi:O-antigen ligase
VAFFLTLVYLFLTLVPPAELHQSLAQANLMAILGVTAIGVGLVEALVTPNRRKAPVQLWLVVALMLWAAFSVVLAFRWLGGAYYALQDLVVNFGVFWLLILSVDSLRKLAIVRGLLLVTLSVLVLMGARDLLAGTFGGRFVFVQGRELPSDELPSEEGVDESSAPQTAKRRMMALGYLADPNQLAQVLAAALPLFLVAWRSGRLLGNLATVVAPAALFVYGVVLTGSRGGLVALAALLAAASYLQGRKWLSCLTAVAVLVASPLALLVAQQTARQEDSAAERMEAWSYGLQLLKKSPIWGAGYGSFLESHELTAHNSFVLCFAELGLVGYLLWLSIFVVSLMQLTQVANSSPSGPDGWRVRRWGAARLSIIGFLAAGFFLSRTFSVMLFTVVGIATAVVSIARPSGADMRSVQPSRVLFVTAAGAFFSIAAIYLSMRIVR